jgi:hypothetical protein
MKWFRSNIKGGARLALISLAVQFVLSFGHFHAIAAPAPATQSIANISIAVDGDRQATSAKQQASAAASQAKQQLPPARPDNDQSADGCAICAVMAMANTVLFATPPLLMLPQAVEFVHLLTDAEFAHLKSAGADFQPRAPPAS